MPGPQAPGAMTLPIILGIHIHEVTTGVVLLVGLLAAALAGVGYGASRRSGNPALGFVAGAFAVFALKSIFSAWGVYARALPHEHLELVLSLADLVILVLLALPLLTRRTPRP